MIETVVGCFGRGGQSQLRLLKKPFRTRRYLHHAFWSHGAGNINLPLWWRYLLQTHESGVSDPNQRGKLVTTEVATSLHELLLGLLYPVQTHALIKRLNRATRSNRQAAQVAKKGSREYTSIAEDLLTGKAGSQRRAQNRGESQDGNVTSQGQKDASNQMAEDLMNQNNDSDKNDELWKLQQDCFETSNPLEDGILKDIFFLLSTSKRKIDLERSLALFGTFNVKSPVLCNRAVKAALELADLETAVSVHHAAATINPGSIDIGTPEILRYAVLHGQWKLAVDIWYRLWQSRIFYRSAHPDLWKDVDLIPLQNLLLKTEEAADFALHATESSNSPDGKGPSREAAVAARDFALSLAGRAFEVKDKPFRQDQYINLLNKIVSFGDNTTKIRSQALMQLLSLKDRGHFPHHLARHEKGFFQTAIAIYRELRQDPNFVPLRSLLEEMFLEFKVLKSWSGMLMILEDWKKFISTKIPIPYYLNMARIAGGSGQVAAVDRIFNSFVDDYPAGEVSETVRSKIMNYSLRVHLKRADATTILEKFHDFQQQHGCVPTTTSYNLIMMTFARIGDVERAIDWFKSLQDSGLGANSYTYTSLMSMYAKRGDLDAVQDLWREVTRSELKPNISMVDALVVANVKDEKFAEAEDLVQKAVTMDLEGSRTHMWNVLLDAYALRGDLAKVSELHSLMYSLGVTEDSDTYAALLLSLCSTGNVNSATRVFRHVMPKLRISRTAVHYAIMMGGCIKEKDYEYVFHLYQDLLEKKLVPDTGIHNALLRAAARKDERDSDAQDRAETYPARAREVLDLTLKSFNPAEIASGGSRKFLGTTPVDQASIASYYGYMIHLYGLKASFSKVNELYDEYIAAAKQAGKENIIDDPPALMLSALLTSHTAAGNDEEVERCWYLALDKYEKLAKRSNANLTQPGWVLPARRFVINPILREYMRHLSNRHRFDELISVIRELRWAGYDLHSPNWNDYVSYLTTSKTPNHRSVAFELCEKELMQTWPGWEQLASTNSTIGGGTAWRMKRVLMRENKGGAQQPYKRIVRYETLVRLAGVYSEAWRGPQASTDNVNREQLQRLAPVTVGALRQMPKIRDEVQKAYLLD